MGGAISGARHAGRLEFRAPQFTQRIDLSGRALRRETRDREFTQMAYIAPLYALRAPPCPLPLGRTYGNGDLR